MLQFVGNTTLWGADKLEVRVTIYRDMDLGKEQLQDATTGKEPWKEQKAPVLVP